MPLFGLSKLIFLVFNEVVLASVCRKRVEGLMDAGRGACAAVLNGKHPDFLIDEFEKLLAQSGDLEHEQNVVQLSSDLHFLILSKCSRKV